MGSLVLEVKVVLRVLRVPAEVVVKMVFLDGHPPQQRLHGR
jgi:hypothetical protein